MYAINAEQMDRLDNAVIELAAITYLLNIINTNNFENNAYFPNFEFLGQSAQSYLVDKLTEQVLNLNNLLNEKNFNESVKA